MEVLWFLIFPLYFSEFPFMIEVADDSTSSAPRCTRQFIYQKGMGWALVPIYPRLCIWDPLVFMAPFLRPTVIVMLSFFWNFPPFHKKNNFLPKKRNQWNLEKNISCVKPSPVWVPLSDCWFYLGLQHSPFQGLVRALWKQIMRRTLSIKKNRWSLIRYS